MRFPKRTRGLVLGAVTLVAGPIIAVTLTASPAAVPMASTAATAPEQPFRLPVANGIWAVRVVPDPVALRSRSPQPVPAAKPVAVKKTSKPKAPAPPAASYSPGSIEGIIMAAAAKYGVSGSWMISIARCESGLNPHAYNPHGPYYGLFQFLMSTFTHNGGTNIWDPVQQADVTANMLAHGQAHQWSCA